ncbi:MAG TPA: SDR family NAD(P)-dependent oxidoreductase, partial [Dehalococcoidales bacterium]|nr:SDR family NAD(P)-dependent oxidoreductase [Dehalococcoidales bacterium]
MNIKGKVVLITGGGTGIGAAIARRFVAEGAKVCITGRRQKLLDAVAQGLPAGSVYTYAGDVTRLEDAQKMVDLTLHFNGKIDVLINNAGVDNPGTVADIDVEV